MTKKSQTRSTSASTKSQVHLEFPTIPSRDPLSPIDSTTLLESQIIVLPEFLSSETCKSFFLQFSSLELLPSPPPGRNEATRTNKRLAIESPDFAKRLFHETCLEEFTKDRAVKLGKRTLRVKGLHSNIRIYKYETNAFFGPHYDSSTRDGWSGFTSYWTLLVYLTGKEDGVEGGETVFYEPYGKGKSDIREIVVGIERGMALLHRHGGSDCLLHEGRTVTKGIKWVLRSDLVFG